jgi:hypothetical protein
MILQVHAWMLKDDPFPSFGGRLDVKGLDFAIYDAPAGFKVSLFLDFGELFVEIQPFELLPATELHTYLESGISRFVYYTISVVINFRLYAGSLLIEHDRL